jgi:RHS repeat-associated protein
MARLGLVIGLLFAAGTCLAQTTQLPAPSNPPRVIEVSNAQFVLLGLGIPPSVVADLPFSGNPGNHSVLVNLDSQESRPKAAFPQTPPSSNNDTPQPNYLMLTDAGGSTPNTAIGPLTGALDIPTPGNKRSYTFRFKNGMLSVEVDCSNVKCKGAVKNTIAGDTATGTLNVDLSSNNFLATQVTLDVTVTDPMGTITAGRYISKAVPDGVYAPGASVGNNFFTIDPISIATGELVATPGPDLSLGGPLPLELRRYYSSYLDFNLDQSAAGFNWMHNFDLRLFLAGNFATVALYGGGRVTFQQNGSTWQTLYPARRAYQLIGSGSNFQFMDPNGNLIYTFSSTSGSLLKIEDRNGNALTVTPSLLGPTTVSDGLGRSLNFVYSNGFLSSVQDQSGRTASYSYTGNDLTGVTDANGNTTSFTYGPGDLLTKTIRPAGNAPYTQSFSGLFQVTQQTDSLGNTTTLAYNSGGTVLTDPLSHNFGVNDAPDPLNVSSFTDAAGRTGSFTYDALHRPASYTDRLGNKSTVAYDPAAGYPASVTDAKGNTTTFTYQAQQQAGFTFYNLTQIAFPDGTTSSFTYDSSGNVLTATDGAGKLRKYTYNSRGQALTATNPSGGVTTFTYNADATLATRKDPAGNVATYSYDNLKRLAKIQHADQTSVSFTRDALDQVLSVTDERAKITKFAYDANTNLKSSTDALNQTTSFLFDTDDLPTSATNPLGNSTQFQYDALGSVTALVNGAREKTSFSYDNLERAKSISDPAGKGPSFTYDAEGRPVTLTDALGNTTKYTVDQLGRTTGVTSPLSENTAFAYDALSRVTSITDALSRTTSFSYEGRGLPDGISAPGGLNSSFTWGDVPVLTSFTDPNGNKWPVSHDSLGRLIRITDPLGQPLQYSYDSRNRVSSIGSPADSVQITYDAAGNVVQATHSDGSTVAYTYDDDNRLTGSSGVSLAYDAAGRMVSSNGLAIARDAAGRISGVTYPPGKVTYFYDARGLLAKISDWAGGSVSFTFDDAHQLVSLSRSNGVVTQYTYNKDGRVLSISDTNVGNSLAAISLTRDSIGRVTASNRSLPQAAAGAPGILPLTFDAANQISGFTYDARGRLTKGDAGSTYKWNPASRLVSYARADGSASFAYDGLGQRISRTGADGVPRSYVLNYATALPSVATVQSAGKDLRYYVYTPGGALLFSIEATGGAHHFYSFDETGSTTFLTGDDGAVTDSYGISSYGEAITAGASNKTDNPFTWQGQLGVMQEPETSLFYMRFRYYDGAFARFLSRDPLFSPDPRQVNPYQYAAGDPISNIDPAGLLTATFPRLPCDSSGAIDALLIQICRTIVRYPSVTNQAGIDTGLAIANTAIDPFGTAAQPFLHGSSDAGGLQFCQDFTQNPPYFPYIQKMRELRIASGCSTLPATNTSKILGLGSAFSVAGTSDTAGNSALNPHSATFSPEGGFPRY